MWVINKTRKDNTERNIGSAEIENRAYDFICCTAVNASSTAHTRQFKLLFYSSYTIRHVKEGRRRFKHQVSYNNWFRTIEQHEPTSWILYLVIYSTIKSTFNNLYAFHPQRFTSFNFNKWWDYQFQVVVPNNATFE